MSPPELSGTISASNSTTAARPIRLRPTLQGLINRLCHRLRSPQEGQLECRNAVGSAVSLKRPAAQRRNIHMPVGRFLVRLSVRYAVLSVVLLASAARAAETETQYLSGLGKDDPVKWEFMCDKGMNANKWSTIGVPSNWQLQGFGIYEYGRPVPAVGLPRTHGIYKRTFTTPATWRDKAVFINFEGVMTDTQVTINVQSAGPIHQGGYYAFKYDITSLLKPAGQKNEIQVDVDDDSMNESVNHAERRGDFWNYAGIFRPVYLEAVPKTFIDRLAINATAAGSLDVDVALSDTRAAAPGSPAATVEMQVFDASGK